MSFGKQDGGWRAGQGSGAHGVAALPTLTRGFGSKVVAVASARRPYLNFGARFWNHGKADGELAVVRVSLFEHREATGFALADAP